MDNKNAQFNVEEATEGLFSFDHSDEHQEVSIGSVQKGVYLGVRTCELFLCFAAVVRVRDII